MHHVIEAVQEVKEVEVARITESLRGSNLRGPLGHRVTVAEKPVGIVQSGQRPPC